jgi:hypothetical protein
MENFVALPKSARTDFFLTEDVETAVFSVGAFVRGALDEVTDMD